LPVRPLADGVEFWVHVRPQLLAGMRGRRKRIRASGDPGALQARLADLASA